MNIVEEHRTTVRYEESTYSVEVSALAERPDGTDEPGDRRIRLAVSGETVDGGRIVEGVLETDLRSAPVLGTLMVDALRSFGGLTRSGRRRNGTSPASQGRPWTAELDAELERCWLAGESVEDIAARFGRSPGGIRARLPRVGCDPENRGHHLPTPPSLRAGGDVEGTRNG